MSAVRIKLSEIAETRERLHLTQVGRCSLCSSHMLATETVLDHCHTTGAIRAALHRSCNALLGKVENNAKRYGVKNLAAWAHGVPAYLQHHQVNRTGLLHPSHKTDEEKRLARNTKARKARVTRKVA
jgi:Recombination endonuclease VII